MTAKFAIWATLIMYREIVWKYVDRVYCMDLIWVGLIICVSIEAGYLCTHREVEWWNHRSQATTSVAHKLGIFWAFLDAVGFNDNDRAR